MFDALVLLASDEYLIRLSRSQYEFPDAIKSGFQKYVTFSGRASRSEFWWFVLFQFIGKLVLSIVPILSMIFALVVFLPWLSVFVRRLHDINKSGWWSCFPFGVGIVIAILFGLPNVLSEFDGNSMSEFLIGPIGSGVATLIVLAVGIFCFIIWPCTKGTTGDNRFGPDPLLSNP